MSSGHTKFHVEGDGTVRFSVHDLVDSLSTEDQVELARRIGHSHEIVQTVVDLLVQGHDASSNGLGWTLSADFERWRTAVLEGLGDIRAHVVRGLLRQRDSSEKRMLAFEQWGEQLRSLLWEHAPDVRVPKRPAYIHGSWFTMEHAQAAVEQMAREAGQESAQ